MAHGAASCRVLDRLVAQAHRYRPEDLAKRYGTLFMGALAVKATRRKQINVLQHLVGQLKGRLAIRIPKNVRSAIPREPGE
jgi:uncharacterized protein YbgA (DUF1722 family)